MRVDINLRNIQGLIFDFDGTLYDYSRFPLRLIMEDPRDLFRIRAERKTRKKFAGCDYGSSETYYEDYFSHLGALCHRDGKVLREWYFTIYLPRMVRILRKHYTPRPGVKELISRLNAADELRGIAVYSDYPFLRERMEAIGLEPESRLGLYGPESFGAQKPAARTFLSIASDMGILPEETLVVGDREDTDGAGARNAGMGFFHLDRGSWETLCSMLKTRF